MGNKKNEKKKATKTTKKVTTKKQEPKKKKGFTLIELLAVIIILGILMIIAIPSVTRYISDSRKSAYVDTAKQIVSGARNKVNEGKLDMFSTDTTYYIDIKCIKTENSLKSPYGEFVKAYVVVTFNGNDYDYYWTSVDSSGQGIKKITKLDKLDVDCIDSNVNESDILNTYGINGRNKYMMIDESTNCGNGSVLQIAGNINGETGEIQQTAAQMLNENEELVYAADANRYVGINPNNFVLFNNELWRIIGIYGQNIKIIKADNPLKDIRYNDSEESITWESSLIKIYLNETYYNTIDSVYKNMIDNGIWYVGYCSYYNTAEQAYNNVKLMTWTGKVGLLSTYEFMYGATIHNDCWHNTSNNDNCSSKNWLYLNKNTNSNAWLMNANNNAKYLPFMLQRFENHKGINSYTGVRYNISDAYPVLYLKDSVNIINGTGTIDDPYTLGM